ncbi:MAG: hypothetical protein OIF57_19835, partial [Marinobacterium sp.]|nr:hypothetical protein [Marinobacterium sp.]
QLAQVQGGAEGYWQQYLDAESEIERMYESRLEQLDAEKLLVEQLSRQIDSLKLSSVSVLTPQQRMAEAKDQWDALLAEVQAEVAAGDYSRVNQLQATGEAYIKETQSVWGSGTAAVNVFNEVVGALESMSATLDSKDFEQRKLDLDNERNTELQRARQSLEHQLQQLIAQNDHLNTMSDLLAGLAGEFSTAIAAVLPSTSGVVVDGSHYHGLPWVPYDGYLSELHKGERVLTAAENAQYPALKAAAARPAPLPLAVAPVPAAPAAPSAEAAGLRELAARLDQLTETLGRLMIEQIDVTETQTDAITDQLRRNEPRQKTRLPA